MHVVVDGILTNYRVFGDKKRVLVILHGWQRSLTDWIPTAQKLADTHMVILVDLPGFGMTQKPDTTNTIYDYETFVKHFLEKLEIKQCVLMGHSFGGRIGILLATHTDMLKKLILVDSGGIEKKNLTVKIKALFYKILSTPLALLLPKPTFEQLKKRIGSSDYKNAGNMRSVFINTVNEDLTPLLPKIHTPTALIWGEKDQTLPVNHAKVFKQLIPHAMLRIVWGAGHHPHLEKPEEFMHVLNDVL